MSNRKTFCLQKLQVEHIWKFSICNNFRNLERVWVVTEHFTRRLSGWESENPAVSWQRFSHLCRFLKTTKKFHFFSIQKSEIFGRNLFSISFAGGGWGSGKSVKHFMFSFHFAPFPRWKEKKFIEGKKFVSTVGAHGRRLGEDGRRPQSETVQCGPADQLEPQIRSQSVWYWTSLRSETVQFRPADQLKTQTSDQTPEARNSQILDLSETRNSLVWTVRWTGTSVEVDPQI